MSGFSDSILAGANKLAREFASSANFVTGSLGWAIFKNGDAEFSNGTFRGNLNANSITASSIGSSVITDSDIQGGTAEELQIIDTDTGGGYITQYATTSTVTTRTASGTYTVPAGVTSIKVEAWGGGGGGQSGGGPGGGGGGYGSQTITVTPLEVLTVTIGAGGTGGTAGGGDGGDGGQSSLLRAGVVLVAALGGQGGAGSATSAGGTGGGGFGNTIHFAGANAYAGTAPPKAGGGGGGGSAAPSGTGGTGKGPVGFVAGAGGSSLVDGGHGGNGGTGSNTTATAGTAGTAPGGGGGSGGAGNGTANYAAGAAGARGQIRISFTATQQLTGSMAPAAGVDAMGTAYRATANELATTYAPAVGGGGTATFTSASGWSLRFGAMVFFAVQIVVNAAGSGAAAVTITTPTNLDRTVRQVFGGQIEGAAAAAVGACYGMTFTGTPGNTVDRIRSAAGRTMLGADLLAGAIINIEGWYREA